MLSLGTWHNSPPGNHFRRFPNYNWIFVAPKPSVACVCCQHAESVCSRINSVVKWETTTATQFTRTDPPLVVTRLIFVVCANIAWRDRTVSVTVQKIQRLLLVRSTKKRHVVYLTVATECTFAQCPDAVIVSITRPARPPARKFRYHIGPMGAMTRPARRHVKKLHDRTKSHLRHTTMTRLHHTNSLTLVATHIHP